MLASLNNQLDEPDNETNNRDSNESSWEQNYTRKRTNNAIQYKTLEQEILDS